MISENQILKVLMDDYKLRTGNSVENAYHIKVAHENISRLTDAVMNAVQNLSDQIRIAVEDGKLDKESATAIKRDAATWVSLHLSSPRL